MGILSRHGQCRLRNVGSINSRSGKFFGERDGEASGSGADVGNEKTVAGSFLRAAGAEFAQRQAIERDFNDMLGFRPGNQHVRRNFEFQAPEFLFAGEMLRGLAICAGA